jgi:hypothetical protein
MSEFKNFKEHWLDFFRDSNRFQTEIIQEDELLETIRVSSPNEDNQTTIELTMFIEEGFYLSMFDIRFFHPGHYGFNKFQRLNQDGYNGINDEFTSENIHGMESTIEGYLENGFSETIYHYNGSHLKSEITLIKEGKPSTFLWKDKEHMMSNKIQRFLNRSFIQSYKVESGKWT